MEKVLVIQTAFIGDAVLTLPMVEKLSKESNLLIDVVAIPGTSEIFTSSPFVNEVIIYDKRGAHKGIKKAIEFAKKIKEKKYSKIFSPHRSFRTSFLVLLSGVNETYGYDNSSFCHAYKHLIHYNKDCHEVERNFQLAGIKNYDLKQSRPIVRFEESLPKIEEFKTANNLGKFVVIAPSSVWETKKYPKKYFVELINYFANQNYNIILSGSKQEFPLCEEIKLLSKGNIINTAGMFNIIETIALISKSILLISNDSAATHFGMCTETPVITLYCSTVPEFGFYPYRNNSLFLGVNNLECKPCGIHGYKECPIGTFECGNKLYPKLVIEKITELLNDNK